MRVAEIDAVVDVAYAALWSYAGETDRPRRRARVAHLCTTDPAGAFIAEEDGYLVGVAMALRRERLWGLSVLAVQDHARGRGLGRELLEAALGHGEGCHARVILSSEHPAAMGAYAGAGLALHPCVSLAGGPARRPPAPPGVRDGSIEDAAWLDDVARAVRGAGYGPDVAHW